MSFFPHTQTHTHKHTQAYTETHPYTQAHIHTHKGTLTHIIIKNFTHSHTHSPGLREAATGHELHHSAERVNCQTRQQRVDGVSGAIGRPELLPGIDLAIIQNRELHT